MCKSSGVPRVAQFCSRRRGSQRGFTLLVCLFLMVLLVVVAVGLLTLASVELRKTSYLNPSATARANARLAMMQAIGQLQRTMGPDQRVSATAEILRKEVKQPHWTGTWRSTLENGSSIFTRDDMAGSLRDERWSKKLNFADQVIEWLVSGTGDPTTQSASDQIPLYQADGKTLVSAPRVTIADTSGKPVGNIAWWTGDLGVRANLGTMDPRADVAVNRSSPADGGIYRVMVSQAADMKLMEEGVEVGNDKLKRMASSRMMDFAGAPADWAKKHAFDYTADSSGVLADVVNGRLKQDLTSYFENGAVAPLMKLPGLADNDPLVGADKQGSTDIGFGTEARYAKGGARFGLLRDWARLGVPFSGKNVAGKQPEFDKSAGLGSAARALANELPVKLAGNTKAGLQPILVEATNFTQMRTLSGSDLAAEDLSDPGAVVSQGRAVESLQLRSQVRPLDHHDPGQRTPGDVDAEQDSLGWDFHLPVAELRGRAGDLVL